MSGQECEREIEFSINNLPFEELPESLWQRTLDNAFTTEPSVSADVVPEDVELVDGEEGYLISADSAEGLLVDDDLEIGHSNANPHVHDEAYSEESGLNHGHDIYLDNVVDVDSSADFPLNYDEF